MTAVPFSYDEQRRIDSAKRYEKAAAQLRKEAEDARRQRQEAEDKRVDLIALEAELKRKEEAERKKDIEFARLRRAQQLDKFERGLKVMESHFRERVGLYDAQLSSFNRTNTFADGRVTITITLKAKP